MCIILISGIIVSYYVVFSLAYLDMSPQELLFGDIGNLEKLFIFPMDNASETRTEEMLVSMMKRDDSSDFADDITEFKVDDPGQDINDFNSITRSLNISRRQAYGRPQGKDDPDDYYKPSITEKRKKDMLINNGLQILIHTRYKVAGALRIRLSFQRDKRYRLGYLFNRLRRLMTEQRKVITIARSQVPPKFDTVEHLDHLDSIMSLYERVVRLDVDMRDTSARIHSEYARYSRADLFF